MNELRVYNNIMELLPNKDNPTPLVRINKISTINIYAKLEWYNPFGAVKDRIAANMIEDAENKGLIQGKSIVEPTSGNTGIGLAAIAGLKGYGMRAILSSKIPEEKKIILKQLGSEVIEVADTLCPDPNAPEGAIGIAISTARNISNKFFMPNQYENEANIEAHYKTTGPEIWKQTDGKITHFIAGLGTCGTISGVAKFLKEKNPNVKIIGVYPEEEHNIPGVRSLKQLKVTKLFKPDLYDNLIEITTKESYNMCSRINREEAIIAGPSSGMALAGAIKYFDRVAEQNEDKEIIAVIIFPDNIFKYTSFLVNKPIISDDMFNMLIEKSRNKYNTIEIEDAKDFIEKEDPMIIDVRNHDIYNQAHLPGAVNISNKDLPESKLLPEDKNKPIITVCNRGNASMTGMLILKSLGYKNVLSLNGGTLGWMQCGLQVEKE